MYWSIRFHLLGSDDLALMELVKEQGYASPEFSKNGRKKKKKKGKKADDLRLKDLGSVLSTGSRRKDRKKKLLEAKKKKLEEAQTEEDMDFRGHEQIKFGAVVEAPPKLTSIPKAFKATSA